MASLPIRILIVDDHPVVRDGLSAMLSTQAEFAVAGQAGTGTEAVKLAGELRPDVVLLDLEMPGLDGVEALRQLRSTLPETRVIVLTAFDTDERIVSAVQAGARGYLLKGAPREEIFTAIRIVNQGGSLLQPIVASKLLRHVSQAESAMPAESLTERETEVLHLLAEGRSNKDIAAALVVSERTVKFHVSSILSKLGAENRTEAVAAAARRGLIHLSGPTSPTA